MVHFKKLALLQRKNCTNSKVGLENDPTFPKKYLNKSTVSGVCSQCKSLNADIISYRKPPIYSSGCLTCMALWQFRGHFDESENTYARVSEGPSLWLYRFNTAELFYSSDSISYDPLPSSASLHVDPWHEIDGVGVWRRNLEGRKGSRPNGWFTPVENLEDVSAQDFFARHPKDTIDFKLVRSWIDSCSSSGNQCNITKIEKPRFLIRVINCVHRSVEWQYRQNPYIALSYTWGKQKHVQFQSDRHGLEKLPDDLPTLILDSIQATLALGYQYLWIDSYCIRQGDQVDTEQQISQMDQIYSLAEATIIAACCSDPSEPLAGVQTGSRTVPPLVELGGHKYRPISYPRIEECHWNTRGWTYQEAVLSRRRIVFFKEQIYFQCHCMIQMESIRMPLQNPFKNRKNQPGDLFPSLLLHESPRQHLLKHINAYISRDMKYESDVLRGFTGILQWFNKRYKNSAHVTGLLLLRDIHFTKSPPPSSISEKFAVSLVWHAEAAAKRRIGFPSWSWMGWHLKGTVVSECHFGDSEALQSSHTQIEVEDDQSQKLTLQEYMETFRLAKPSGFIPALIIQAPMLQLSITTYTNYSNHSKGRRSIVNVSGVGTMYAIVSLTGHEPWQRRMLTGLVLGARAASEIVVLLVKEVEDGSWKKTERVGVMILGVDPPNVEKCIRISDTCVQTIRLV